MSGRPLKYPPQGNAKNPHFLNVSTPRAMTHCNKIWDKWNHKYYSTHMKPNKGIKKKFYAKQ
jgi:hypothetical protein